METRFILTQGDFWHFLTYVFFRRRHRFWVLLLLIYVILALFVVMMDGPSFALAVFWPWLVLLLIPIFLVLRMRRIAARGAGRGGEHVVSLTPEGLREKTDWGEGIRFWRTFKTIDQDHHNLYLIADNVDSNAVAATIIPRHAFSTPQEAEMFLQEARQHWMQGRGMLPDERQEGSTGHES